MTVLGNLRQSLGLEADNRGAEARSKPTATKERRPKPRRGQPAAARERAQSARTKRPRHAHALFLTLFGIVLSLTVFGLMMVLSSSSVVSLRENGHIWGVFNKQFIWAGCGSIAMVVVMQTPYRMWRKLAMPLLIASIIALVLLLLPIPGLRHTVNGSTRWLGLGIFIFQPSEVAKLAAVLFTSDLLSRRMSRMDDWRQTLRPVLMVTGLLCALIVVEPDLGTSVVLAGIVGVMLFVAGIRLAPLAGISVAGLGLVFALAASADYRRRRLVGVWDPWDDVFGTDQQTIQALVGIANGGTTGSGLGASRVKWQYLPEAHSDFIFAIIAEETGLLGAVVVISLFLGIGIFGTQTALRAPDPFGTLLAAGVTAWILLQALINLATVVGVVPITGVTLPFVSAGGSSLVVMMVAAGILLSIARDTRPSRGRRKAKRKARNQRLTQAAEAKRKAQQERAKLREEANKPEEPVYIDLTDTKEPANSGV